MTDQPTDDPPGVAVAVIADDGRVLLVRRRVAEEELPTCAKVTVWWSRWEVTVRNQVEGRSPCLLTSVSSRTRPRRDPLCMMHAL